MIGKMWAVDVEGNGASPPEIVELAIVQIDGLQLTGKHKHWRFKPKTPITPAVSRIHGIWDSDVAGEPEIEDVADDIQLWLEDLPIVGHNVRVELDILSRSLDDWQPTAAYDTLKMARRVLPNQEKYGLEHIGRVLGLDAVAANAVGGMPHSAPFDAALSGILLGYLLLPLSEAQRETVMAEADILRNQQASLF